MAEGMEVAVCGADDRMERPVVFLGPVAPGLSGTDKCVAEIGVGAPRHHVDRKPVSRAHHSLTT